MIPTDSVQERQAPEKGTHCRSISLFTRKKGGQKKGKNGGQEKAA